jgi:hypothetical protein
MTQNQGNSLGDRPCVRQSRLYRELCGGNTMKELMGQDQLKWDTGRTEGAYQGGRVFDHNTHAYERAEPGQQRQPHPAYAQQQQSVYSQQPHQQASTQQVAQPAYSQASQVPWATSDQQPANAQQHAGHRRGAGQANRQSYNLLTGGD